MCRIDDCDGASVNHREWRRAAKPHQCCECRRTIEKGEEHQYTFMIMEGEPMTFRLCQHCLAAAGWLIRECGGYVFEVIGEELIEHAVEYPHVADALAPLIAGIKAQWRDANGLMPLPVVPDATTAELSV